MWVFTKDGFYSAVQHKDDPKVIIVRTRFREDVDNLVLALKPYLGKLYFKKLEVEDTPEADYPFRVQVSRFAWRYYMSIAVEDLDYSNFKEQVVPDESYGSDRWVRYHDVWSAMRGHSGNLFSRAFDRPLHR